VGKRGVIGTTLRRDYASLPPLSTEPELALGSGLLREKGLTQAPAYNLLANVHGDAKRERVLVYGRYLVVLGPNYRAGRQFFYRDLGSDADRGELSRFELRDVTADGRKDILLERRFVAAGGRVRLFEVFSFHEGSDTPTRVFAHVTGWSRASGREARARVTYRRAAKGIVFDISAADPPRSDAPMIDGAEALFMKGSGVAARGYRFDGVRFSLDREERSASAHPPRPHPLAGRPVRQPTRPPSDAQPPSARPPSRDEKTLTHRGVRPSRKGTAYGLYKKRRGITGAPRFDLRGDVAGDATRERVVMHGLDLIVFGPAFRGGRGYAAITLPAFAKAADVTRVSLRPAARGRHRIIEVRGIIRGTPATPDRSASTSRQVVLRFAIRGGHFERIVDSD
jgi:hypothetical protein